MGFNFLKLCVFVLCANTVLSTTVQAKTVVAIVSSRNSADVLSGVQQFLRDYPQHRIVLRNTEQFEILSDSQREQLLQQADLVFAGAMFGDAVTWLQSFVRSPSSAGLNFLAVHGDRRLVLESRLGSRPLLPGANLDVLMENPPLDLGLNFADWSRGRLLEHAAYSEWLLAKTFWSDRDSDNMNALMRHLFRLAGEDITVPEPKLRAPLRIIVEGESVTAAQLNLDKNKQWVAVLDSQTGDRPGEKALIDQLCEQIAAQGHGCLRLLATWGEASVQAIKVLTQQRQTIAAVVSVQNFLIGGGEGRQRVNADLAELKVPVLKAIRLTDSTREQWALSEQGLPWSSVHYRVAMPELQGVIEPMVVAAMTASSIDADTGVELSLSQPIASQISLLVSRLNRWLALQTLANAEKKIAIIYYNHPPGRHNIGADNLNVPASLLQILQQLKEAGYNTGELPESEQALLDQLQLSGVNLPEDRQALEAMAGRVNTVSESQYRQWFETLAPILQDEMIQGPLGYLHTMLQRAVEIEDRDIGRSLLARVVEDLRHAIESADHPARERVMQLLAQLQQTYSQALDGNVNWDQAQQLVSAIAASGVEGIRGWGELPGQVMVHEQRLLIPGLQFGNIFIGPQPPRGWELNEEILHANLSFPPTHQYLAFYQWLRQEFGADALVHLGRHSTYEFLPHRHVGLGEEDYSLALIGDLPSIYPYIVDGVGEGIQAKRRGFAVIVDHLTPPLDSTELYDRLLELRQLIESYEAAPDTASAMRQRAIQAIKTLIEELNLIDELMLSMSGELQVRGISADDFDAIDDELLVHEVGHYLTRLQEDFMPLGLHAFGRDWDEEALTTMLNSMAKSLQEGEAIPRQWRHLLSQSPSAEIEALLNALDGQYIVPGKGNDPIKTPEALPTGRNFYALDGSLIPSRLGYEVGVELALLARLNSDEEVSEAVVLWASDVVRDEGAMIAFGLDMLGLKPVWSSRGIVNSLERLPIDSLTENNQPRQRHDIVFTTSGLFRDLYGSQIVWLDRAVLMALDASAQLIRRDYPALTLALSGALAPLGDLQNPGEESLTLNLVARNWVRDARNALNRGVDAQLAGRQAAYRIFGDAPGTYGAGVNRLIERSGSWQDRSEIAEVYMRRMGHAYGIDVHGEPEVETLKRRLSTVGKTYLGRASNLYGLLDNNDSFDYLGGLSLAIETLQGQAPENFVISHSDINDLSLLPLELALLTELRGRFLNPQWLKPLMLEEYAGARTMGSEFFEYLWGWQVTNPDIIKSWVWDEVKSVYIDDSLNLGLDEFLEAGHNVHVKSNILAVMLVAAQKQFWQADEATLRQLSEQFAALVLENGLPGSGHTRPDHPLYNFLADYLPAEQYARLQQMVAATKVETNAVAAPTMVAEISVVTNESEAAEPTNPEQRNSQSQANDEAQSFNYFYLLLIGLVLLIFGAYRGMRLPENSKGKR